jgi:glycosyltransferase involved in cell wall biosynthesis
MYGEAALRVVIDAGNYHLGIARRDGISQRALELTEALGEVFDVVLLAADIAKVGSVRGSSVAPPRSAWVDLVRTADVVLFFDSPDIERFRAAVAGRARVVSETTPPIEHMMYTSVAGAPDPDHAYGPTRAAFELQVDESDHFLCRSRIERATIVSSLVARGRVWPADLVRSATLSHLLTTVPIGYGPSAAEQARKTAATRLADLVWTGGLWPFYDPEALIEALARCRDLGRVPSVAFLQATPHPDTDPVIRKLRRLVAEFGLDDKVRLVDQPMSDGDRHAALAGAQAAVCIGRPGAENETCVRLRIRDSRLHGLPLVVDPYGATADEIHREGGGVVLAGTDPDTLARELLNVTASQARRQFQPAARFNYASSTKELQQWILTSV